MTNNSAEQILSGFELLVEGDSLSNLQDAEADEMMELCQKLISMVETIKTAAVNAL